MESQQSDAKRKATSNHVLAALQSSERDHLLSRMELVTLGIRQIVWEPNALIDTVYFPVTAVFSLVAVMDDSKVAEVATIGNEGMAGMPVFLGAERTPLRALCQVAGEALRMGAEHFREEIAVARSMTAVLHRYTECLFVQVSQSAACNRLHSIQQRCARWLLMTHDRVGADQFDLTQEFLAQMVGVRRASANEAAKSLQRAGYIRYSRGAITILNREGLENAACECYQIIRREYDRPLA